MISSHYSLGYYFADYCVGYNGYFIPCYPVYTYVLFTKYEQTGKANPRNTSRTAEATYYR